jgi:hypothetical protein
MGITRQRRARQRPHQTLLEQMERVRMGNSEEEDHVYGEFHSEKIGHTTAQLAMKTKQDSDSC